VVPSLARPSTACAIASATSPANTGCIRVPPPPISGNAGASTAIEPNRLKNESSGPNMIEGRMTMASGTADRTSISASALLRA
jgi:hypothetical protein